MALLMKNIKLEDVLAPRVGFCVASPIWYSRKVAPSLIPCSASNSADLEYQQLQNSATHQASVMCRRV